MEGQGEGRGDRIGCDGGKGREDGGNGREDGGMGNGG